MTSKYDEFWIAQLPELRAAIEAAARDGSRTVTVDDLPTLGARRSWSGVALVRGEIVESASMAPLRSLANQVARAGLCQSWAGDAFRFKMSSNGTQLSITRPTLARAAAMPRNPIRGGRPAALLVDRPSSSSAISARAACSEVHRLVAQLREHRNPSDVGFANGLYFFYEDGERSTHALAGRIVRIGNHPKAQDRLVGRLGDHYRSTVGAKNRSVFRRYMGGALLRSEDPSAACLAPGPGSGHWEHQDGQACRLCQEAETAVSEVLANRFRFRCVQIDDMTQRNHLERRLIATVAACDVCRPSTRWLGLHAYPDLVRSSGLWNKQHVGRVEATSEDLALFRRQAAATALLQAQSLPPLDDTLLVIPCSSAKEGAQALSLAPIRIADMLNAAARGLLEEGRRAAFARSGTSLDLASPLRPALAYYTGQPYSTPGVRDAVVAAIRRGLHCLIVSGGYGVIRAEEPIHRYNAHLSSQTRSVWARLLSPILRDYVARNGISRTITVVSSGYASVLPHDLTGDDLRSVPVFVRGVDHGAALRVVPERVGAAVAEVLSTL